MVGWWGSPLCTFFQISTYSIYEVIKESLFIAQVEMGGRKAAVVVRRPGPLSLRDVLAFVDPSSHGLYSLIVGNCSYKDSKATKTGNYPVSHTRLLQKLRRTDSLGYRIVAFCVPLLSIHDCVSASLLFRVTHIFDWRKLTLTIL